MALTFEEVDGFFDQYGWSEYVEKSGDTSWRVLVKGKQVDYDMYADLSEYFLFIYIVPLLKLPDEPTCRINLCEHLLRLNRDISITKFVLTEDSVELLGVLTTESVQYEEFSSMIDLLIYNADENYLEIMNIAGDPSEVSSYLGGEE